VSEDKPLLDERLVLPGRGNSRDISRNPVFDGKVPTSRSKRQNRDLTAVGPAGERYDNVATLAATAINVRISGGGQSLTHSIGSLRGYSLYSTADVLLTFYSGNSSSGTILAVVSIAANTSVTAMLGDWGVSFNGLYLTADDDVFVYGSIWLASVE